LAAIASRRKRQDAKIPLDSSAMLSSFSILLIGFVLGMRHATDADHVVAVTTIVSDQPSLWRASVIGALWGVGHSITILLVGGAIIAFRIGIPPRLGLAMEFTVALMLIVLGALNLSGRHVAHANSAARPLAVGFVHGLAGSAFVALVVVAAVPGLTQGLLYLALFGLGTVGGMALVTLAIAVPSALSARRFVSVQRYLRLASGVASVAFGVMLARDGIADGLFSANPHWSPR
jgi:high-affinity nickel-transport protein